MYRDLRCEKCNKKLCEATGKYKIAAKCPRCKYDNQFCNY